MKYLSFTDVKSALKDHRFRETLPKEYEKELATFVSNPGCSCNVKLYEKILKECKTQLQAYYPNKEIKEETSYLMDNKWNVINCHIDELEAALKKLPPGRKQLAMTRFEDQVTVVVNELEFT